MTPLVQSHNVHLRPSLVQKKVDNSKESANHAIKDYKDYYRDGFPQRHGRHDKKVLSSQTDNRYKSYDNTAKKHCTGDHTCFSNFGCNTGAPQLSHFKSPPNISMRANWMERESTRFDKFIDCSPSSKTYKYKRRKARNQTLQGVDKYGQVRSLERQRSNQRGSRRFARNSEDADSRAITKHLKRETHRRVDLVKEKGLIRTEQTQCYMKLPPGRQLPNHKDKSRKRNNDTVRMNKKKPTFIQFYREGSASSIQDTDTPPPCRQFPYHHKDKSSNRNDDTFRMNKKKPTFIQFYKKGSASSIQDTDTPLQYRNENLLPPDYHGAYQISETTASTSDSLAHSTSESLTTPNTGRTIKWLILPPVDLDAISEDAMSRISSVETADTSYLGTRSSSSVYSQQPTRIPSVKFMTPHPSRANHDLHYNSYRQPYHVYPSTEGPMIDAGTNDFPIAHSLATGRPLPYGQFKTVSLLLESPKRGDILGWNRKAQDYRIPVSATAGDHAPLATHFKPFVPPGAENTEETFEGSVQKSRSYLLELLDIPVRKPPVQFKPTKNKEMMGPSTKPPNHRGIVWPLAFATEPPYTTPGHEVPGVKQPVGVLQTKAPPPRPVRDSAGGLAGGDIPDWISPLYTTFGIGGPYGRNGPFYTPRVMPTPRDQWANLVREAAASRTPDVPVPAIVKKDKRPDIESLCDDYMFVKRQQDLEAKARRCRICLKFKEFIAKIERKLGLATNTMRRQKQVQRQQQVQKSGQPSKATSVENKDQPVINNSYPTKNMESKITSNDSLSYEVNPRVLEQLLYASPTSSLLSLEEGELERLALSTLNI